MAAPERLLYIEVIEVIVQSGPELLAVIWRVVALGRWSLMEVPLYTCTFNYPTRFQTKKTFLISEQTPLDYRIDIITAVEV